MKKGIICIFIILAIILGCNAWQKNQEETISNFVLRTLNGYEISEYEGRLSDKVFNWGVRYQEESFYPNDYKYIIFDDVVGFNNYKSEMIAMSEYLETDPFCVIENLENYDAENMDKYFPYFKFKGTVFDSRVIEENGKYCIYINDMAFDKAGYDYISYGDFHSYVDKDEIKKFTFEQAQNGNYIEEVGITRDGLTSVFVYYDSMKNDKIEFAVKSVFGFVISCVRI